MRRRASKLFLLLIGDILVLYISLVAALVLRRGGAFYEELVSRHLLPFTILFCVWLFVFYIAGLYDLRRLRNDVHFLKNLLLTLFVSAFIAVCFFYLIPVFGIAPKTTLFLFLIVFAVLGVSWRRLFNRLMAEHAPRIRTLLIGGTDMVRETHAAVTENPQLGYTIAHWIEDHATAADDLVRLADEKKVHVVVVPRALKDGDLTRSLYILLGSGVQVYDAVHFYELTFGKVPLGEVEEEWFLEHLSETQRFYDELKRGIEFLIALILQIVLVPLEIILALGILLTSRGPLMFRHIRVGKQGKPFMFYKFRTMRVDAEADGARWAEHKDPRVTPFGRFLRYTHLDELPQLINILKGELSFVGPRPERPEFVELLREKVPHYDIRHLIEPGITGWAQINYRYASSVEDAHEKLQYDIYYLKNRSLALDLAIMLKTLKLLFVRQS